MTDYEDLQKLYSDSREKSKLKEKANCIEVANTLLKEITVGLGIPENMISPKKFWSGNFISQKDFWQFSITITIQVPKDKLQANQYIPEEFINIVFLIKAEKEEFEIKIKGRTYKIAEPTHPPKYIVPVIRELLYEIYENENNEYFENDRNINL
jgi:hypothetical protein